ncbi:hypothetical protein [Buchnera aphidicola]|uniref:hypothetical protein n=1 Tax=Buchnera aphidicola TaxID=9 RepID=UPI00094C90E0|nr:hypothetical protein [Buchnera aphidicola]
MIHNSFYKKYVCLSSNISDTLISLEQWSLIRVTGIDKKKYLNNQFTININDIYRDIYKVGAYCNLQGKVLAIFLIFKYYGCYMYVVRSSIVPQHLLELNKYALFSKVNISEEKNFFLYGLCGKRVYGLLEIFFSQSIKRDKKFFVINNFIVLKLQEPIQRLLIIVPRAGLACFLNFMRDKVLFSYSSQWLALDIEANFPVFDPPISGRFILQTMGLKKWNAITFNKGCYYGQEALCMYENKKINKFIICSLLGTMVCSCSPKVREYVEYIDSYGLTCQVGIILSWVFVHKEKILLQVRMKKFFFKEQNRFFLSSCPKVLFSIHMF